MWKNTVSNSYTFAYILQYSGMPYTSITWFVINIFGFPGTYGAPLYDPYIFFELLAMDYNYETWHDPICQE